MSHRPCCTLISRASACRYEMLCDSSLEFLQRNIRETLVHGSHLRVNGEGVVKREVNEPGKYRHVQALLSASGGGCRAHLIHPVDTVHEYIVGRDNCRDLDYSLMKVFLSSPATDVAQPVNTINCFLAFVRQNFC